MSNNSRRSTNEIAFNSYYDLNKKTNSLYQRSKIIFLPQLLVCTIFIVYVVFGAFAFCQLDESIANQNFTNVVLFSFTTLATIGYGNISPTTTEARCFCLLYSTLGVPLCVVVLGNLTKHLTKAFWMIRICFGGNIRRPMGDATLPLKFILLFFFVLFMFGCLIYPEDLYPKDFTLRNLYFSVVSFATVGFGDEHPDPNTFGRMISMFIYLMIGMILSGMMFAVLHQKLKRIHKISNRIRGARDVTVWFGSREMKVSKLLEIVAEEFDAKPRAIHEMLHNLDELLEAEIERRASTTNLNLTSN